jgi:hypothetical protein
LGIISHTKSILVQYISTSARTASLIDKTMMAPTQYQRFLLAWRRGKLFLNRKCLCGASWHRGHIPCLPNVVLSPAHKVLYVAMKDSHSKNFCEVDFLLNIGEWKVAYEVLKEWEHVFAVK